MWPVPKQRLLPSSRAALIAENLFLCKQLAVFQQRKVRSRRSNAADSGDGPPWGKERIADELKIKLGVRVSPRAALAADSQRILLWALAH
jgi:hypothetical protein